MQNVNKMPSIVQIPPYNMLDYLAKLIIFVSADTIHIKFQIFLIVAKRELSLCGYRFSSQNIMHSSCWKTNCPSGVVKEHIVLKHHTCGKTKDSKLALSNCKKVHFLLVIWITIS